jgi:hypothetical protein
VIRPDHHQPRGLDDGDLRSTEPEMKMDPQWIIAVCAAATLLITWTGSIAGGVVWLMRRLDAIKKEILLDFHTKHEENTKKVAALETLVISHDTILDPEFNGTGAKVRSRQ